MLHRQHDAWLQVRAPRGKRQACMMRLRLDRMTAAWQRKDLLEWLARQFPDYCARRSRGELDAYVESRTELARDLGFVLHHHLRFLIGYELGCGISLQREDMLMASGAVQRLLMQRDVNPADRIETVEHLLYGADDGT